MLRIVKNKYISCVVILWEYKVRTLGSYLGITTGYSGPQADLSALVFILLLPDLVCFAVPPDLVCFVMQGGGLWFISVDARVGNNMIFGST